MREQLISFETAKLAKEKGFPQENYYLTKEQIEEAGPLMYTQSLLQKWLREEHCLIITIYPKLSLEEFIYLVNIFDPTFFKIKEGCIEKDTTYQTYEEALEIGLLEGLKLI